MSMRDRARETASNIADLVNASEEEKRQIEDACFTLVMDLQIEFTRVSGNYLERKILEAFNKESL